MASRENKFLALHKFGHDSFVTECERLGLKQLAYAVVKLTLGDAVALTAAALGPEPSDTQRLIGSIGMLGMIDHRYLSGFEVTGATDRNEVFLKLDAIKQECALTDSALGAFPLDYPPADFNPTNLPNECLRLSEIDRVLFPSSPEILAIFEQIATNKANHLNLDDIYKSHDEELANMHLQRICPGVWYHPFGDFAREGYRLGTTRALGDFKRAAKVCGMNAPHATYVFRRLCEHLCDNSLSGEKYKKEAREHLDDIFYRRWQNSPGLILVENDAIRRAKAGLETGGTIKGLSKKGYQILKEVSLRIDKNQQSVEALCPINEHLFYVLRLSTKDRESGHYITDAEFSEGCRLVKKGSGAGTPIFMKLVDYFIQEGGEPQTDPIWAAIKRERSQQQREKSPYILALKTQSVADLIEKIKSGSPIPGLSIKDQELLELMFIDDNPYDVPKITPDEEESVALDGDEPLGLEEL
jgi:hypothetical protein